MSTSNNIIAFPAKASAAANQGSGKAPQATAIASTNAHEIVTFPRPAHPEAATAAPVRQAPGTPLTVGEIWDALNNARVVVQYQPQYDMTTGRAVAAEALVRLSAEDGNLIYPDRFIEVVENSDMVVPLGRAVISQVCEDLANCRTTGVPLQRVAVNVSARQLNADTGLVAFVDELIARHNLHHTDIEFELTERQGLTPECDGSATLDALAQRGSRIVIDDFGMGYSSVVYLTELPVSALKLDRELVAKLEDSPAMQSVATALLTLAKSLGLEVVAEGIETQGQHDLLEAAGCEYAQGFRFAVPLAIEDLQSFIRSRNLIGKTGRIGV